MMKKMLPLLVLAGCTPTVASETPQTDADMAAPAQGTCRVEALTDLVGTQVSDALVADAVARSGAKASRTVGPDTVVTMDYRPDRLNIHTDASGTVTKFRCG